MKDLYYWLDLYGPEGKPAMSKVLATLTQFVLLVILMVVAVRVPSMELVWLVLAVGSLPYGLDGLKSLGNMKWGTELAVAKVASQGTVAEAPAKLPTTPAAARLAETAEHAVPEEEWADGRTGVL
jgi:hypothetical protein